MLVGGGMGRTPIIGTVIREFLPWQQILVFIEAIVRVYNRYGRRDNMYKARIKILVKAEGQKFIDAVEAEFANILERDVDGAAHLIPQAELDRVAARFALPDGRARRRRRASPTPRRRDAPLAYTRWLERNVHAHQLAGYRAVTLSLKRAGQAPGDATADQMDAAADLADRFSHGELRVTHDQNLLLPWVRESDLPALWQAAREASFATPNIGLLTDMIACPGGDFCALANARSIPIAAAITERFDDLDELLRHRRHRPAHQRLHQLLRPPPQRPHRHPRRRQGRRGVVPGHARRLRRLDAVSGARDARQGDRPVVRRRRSARRDRGA